MEWNMAERITARVLMKKWGVDVRHGLYRETGDWYHQLERFPAAFFDIDGYVIFETEEAYRACPQLRLRQDVAAPEGIKEIPGYIHVVVDGVERQPQNQQRVTYERAIKFREGAAVEVLQTRYERDPRARELCLDHHGYKCVVCGFDFEERYGNIGKGFIHVHHLEQLARGGEEREVDPIADLCPVCPNCHAMLHYKRREPLSIEALKIILASRGFGES